MKSALHDLSHDVKLSGNMGELLPVCVFDALPGDRVDHRITAMLRTQPLLTPVMHTVHCKFHSWFVPLRLIWEDFEDFITGGVDGLDASVAPYMDSPVGTGYAVGSLHDYLGVPTGVGSLRHSALFARAYNLIVNNWYLDEQLQTPRVISLASGADTTTTITLQNGCWEKDRFTSARPAPQLGTAVTIPLAGNAPVESTSEDVQIQFASGGGDRNIVGRPAASSDLSYSGAALGANSNLRFGTNTGLEADLSSVSAFDIEELREASAVQRFMENMNMWGARYIERLQTAFGVNPQDFRLQLPEYLGGGDNVIQFSEVLQTAEGTAPVGEMRGHGIMGQRSNRYRYFAREHGIVITLMCVRPRTQYIQGLPKMWSRDTKFDYFQPELSHLGDQPVLNKEVYAAHSSPAGVFGYQNCWDEYRFLESRVAGEFRTTLKDWHMAREFSSDPALNSTFVTSNPTTRIYASASDDQLYVTVRHKLFNRRRVSKVARPMLF